MGEAWCNDQFISYKNILQEYCQKKNLPIPSYKSEKKSIGYFGLVSFGFELMKSQVAMPTAKEADQRVAFEALKNAQVIPNDAKFNEPSEVELPSMYNIDMYLLNASADPVQNLTFAKLGPCPFLPRPYVNLTESCRLYKGGYFILFFG